MTNPTKTTIPMSDKLAGVRYELRGKVLAAAEKIEAAGEKVLKLHIGNPAPFNFHAPESLHESVAAHLRDAQGYTSSKGLLSARTAIVDNLTVRGVENIKADNIFMGNGVSELIVMACQALLNNGDEVLIPAPDYPLWTAAVRLAGGKAVHYLCDEAEDWFPSVDDMRAKLTPNTKAVVLINPNNPTGAVYSEDRLKEIATFAAENNLVVFSDEIYSRIVFDDAVFIPMAKIIQDLDSRVLCMSFDGISKNSFAAGFRCGWMTLSGDLDGAADYITGLIMLASLRLCPNVPAMFAVEAALTQPDGMADLLAPGGRLYEQRALAHRVVNSIPGMSCTMPKGAFYLFPKFDPKALDIGNDEDFAMGLLQEHKVMIVPGTAFNYPTEDHFRIVFLSEIEELDMAVNAIKTFSIARQG
ncbi:MAG: pyridoxal phosphate-dependent aminotransferase [Yoonia sp.]